MCSTRNVQTKTKERTGRGLTGLVLGGVLPRKTFSMGHAQEKRYYMECRDIDPDFARHAESLSTRL